MYQGSLHDYEWDKTITDTKNMFTSFHGKIELWKYLGGLLSITFDEADLEDRTKKWINYISIFNNKHIIQSYNIPQSNIPE